MTCVIGYSFEGRAFLAADTAVGHFGDKMRISGKKYAIWETPAGPLGIGFAGSGRIAQAVSLLWKPPAIPENQEAYPYVVAESLAAFIWDLPLADGLKGNEEAGIAIDATLMLAWQGRLAVLGGSICVMTWDRPYVAIGAGAEYAGGALEMAELLEGPPKNLGDAQKRVLQALRIASEICEGVRPPFDLDLLNVDSASKEDVDNG